MKDWAQPLRKAYYDLLNGVVVIDSGFVPVFQERVADNEPSNIYIVIGDIVSSNADDFTTYNSEVFLNLDVVSRQQSGMGDEVDTMVDQIKTLLFPTRTTRGIAQPSGFQVSEIWIESENELPVAELPIGYLKRKILRIHHKIVDNN